ncbi:uncharacterized protein LOC112271956 [Brachypodium distachyon]|nr:uncharacterized protein LOC112271956 [Brachypodium distachyon]|eukprot:XP_024318024.1 uncharacterized protein LOC112271956 [Brachypodium distachyon]
MKEKALNAIHGAGRATPLHLTDLINFFMITWQERGLKPQDFNKLSVIYPRVPTQDNTDDCGIFAMKFMELWEPRNRQSCCFSRSDIPNFRIKLANEMMFSPDNIEVQAKILVDNYFRKGQV